MRTNREETMPTRTRKFRYTFFPDTLNPWNHLSSFIKSSISLNVFKKRLMEFFNVTPYHIYGIHNPVCLKYLTRLRVGLSFLRAHKHQYNFSDTSSKQCSCRDSLPETVEYYLLHCPVYSLLRRELFGNLRLIVSLLTLTSSANTCNLLFYGNPFYDFHTNKEILELTISFIISSKRFDGLLISND